MLDRATRLNGPLGAAAELDIANSPSTFEVSTTARRNEIAKNVRDPIHRWRQGSCAFELRRESRYD